MEAANRYRDQEAETIVLDASLRGRRWRVLLAEHDGSLRRLVALGLRREGFEVIETRDGLELLAEIERTLAGDGVHPDSVLVVAEVDLPGLTGLDVLAVLRCGRAPTPVILIAPRGDAETCSEAWELGATALLDKPFDVQGLCTLVRKHAER